MDRQRFVDLLAMSRFANLPTVWSNALLGLLVASQLTGVLTIPSIVAIVFSLSCLYLGGCFLNDWRDAEFDKKHRPERAIPCGRWARQTVGLFAFILLALGIVIGGVISLPYAAVALGIVICIVAYTQWHKTHVFSLFFMAGARALIYPACVSAPLTWSDLQQIEWARFPILIIFSLALASYILGISLMARFESRKSEDDDKHSVIPLIFLSLPAFLISGILLISIILNPPIPINMMLAGVIPLVFFIGVLTWNVKRLQRTHEVGTFVAISLAAIPLVDGLFVMHAGITTGNISLIVTCPILALAALGLQKIAPAT